MDPVKKGWQTALKLFAVFGAIHLILFLGTVAFNDMAMVTALSGIITIPAALITAAIRSAFLEPGSRLSFWLTVIGGMVALAMVWLSTCAGALQLL
ncbi:MAG TPA: hypothetical protein VNT75_33420 [Symbiobacteriaceae bacterium]|nr:hypothetical protein [Symbiobacteriaceae bacterium]